MCSRAQSALPSCPEGRHGQPGTEVQAAERARPPPSLPGSARGQLTALRAPEPRGRAAPCLETRAASAAGLGDRAAPGAPRDQPPPPLLRWPSREDPRLRHPRRPASAPCAPLLLGKALREWRGFRRSLPQRGGMEGGRRGGKRAAAAAPTLFCVKVKHIHSQARPPPNPCCGPIHSHGRCHASGGSIPGPPGPLP